MWLVLLHLLSCLRNGLIETERESLSAFLPFKSAVFRQSAFSRSSASFMPMSSRPDAVRCILLCLSRLSFSVRPFGGRFWCAWPRSDGGIPLSVRRNGKVSMPLAGCHGRCRLQIARYARFACRCLPQRSSDGFSSCLSSSPAVFRGLRRPRAGFLPLRRA